VLLHFSGSVFTILYLALLFNQIGQNATESIAISAFPLFFLGLYRASYNIISEEVTGFPRCLSRK